MNAAVVVSWHPGERDLEIRSLSGEVIATHRRRPPGAGALARLEEHGTALECAVLSAFTTQRPCRRKANRPPSQAARAIAAQIMGELVQQVLPVVDPRRYEELMPHVP
jgi:hypothetical protein